MVNRVDQPAPVEIEQETPHPSEGGSEEIG